MAAARACVARRGRELNSATAGVQPRVRTDAVLCYLRRNPNDSQDTDYTGYEFWVNKLNQFNGNFLATEMVRAFINSTEYRQRFGL